eukprot:138381_1
MNISRWSNINWFIICIIISIIYRNTITSKICIISNNITIKIIKCVSDLLLITLTRGLDGLSYPIYNPPTGNPMAPHPIYNPPVASTAPYPIYNASGNPTTPYPICNPNPPVASTAPYPIYNASGNPTTPYPICNPPTSNPMAPYPIYNPPTAPYPICNQPTGNPMAPHPIYNPPVASTAPYPIYNASGDPTAIIIHLTVTVSITTNIITWKSK